MYLRDGLIRFLKIKNLIFVIVGVFLAAFCVETMTELTVFYWGDWETILTARRTPESAVLFLVGVGLILASRVSRRLIQDANFFSRYFEGDLSGYIGFEELAEVTGRTAAQIRRRLKLLRRIYMKKFRFVRSGGPEGEQIELYSKKVSCVCRSCGGEIEKRVYFTGECPWCGGSDLSAKVISGERFYCITENENRRVNDPSYYEARGLNKKIVWLTVGLVLAAGFVSFFLIMLLHQLVHFNDKAYLTREILSSDTHHRSTFELVQRHMRNLIILASFSVAAIGTAIPVLLKRLTVLRKARRYARFFSRIPTPYVPVSELAGTGSGNARRELRGVVRAIREGDLKGCSPEKHGGPLRIGLAKRIVKDRCPSCAAPITGAVDENYRCHYCGSLIMGVIRKH